MSSGRVHILYRLQALGESYLALRGELGEVLREMGIGDDALLADAEETTGGRRSILDRLERGEIGVEAAARALETPPARGQLLVQ